MQSARLADVVRCAEGLSAALQRFWALPEQVAAARLELAQPAASRSCAYLACANLGGSGGPAAGEGEGGWRGDVRACAGSGREPQPPLAAVGTLRSARLRTCSLASQAQINAQA